MDGTLITIKEAAGKLDLTPQQVRNLCRDNKLYAEKVGTAWVLQEQQVINYMASNSCGKTEDKPANPGTRSDTGNEFSFDQPVALSFFTGAMGLDLGIEKAGFKTLLACEVDKACRKTIVKNKPDIALIGDIRNYSAADIRYKAGLSEVDDIDLIVGGPPCQAFSTAGRRKGFEDERGNVFLTFLDRIVDLRPKFAVIENVRGILSAGYHLNGIKGVDEPIKGGALKHIIDRLRDAGYGVSFNLYNAANFGTPQKRERVLIIASRDGRSLPHLTPTHSENGNYGLPKWLTFEDAVQGLPRTNLKHLNFPEKRLKYYRMLQPGQYWKSLPEDLQKEALGKSYYSGGGKTGFFRRLAWDQPSPTLVTHPAMPATDLAHPEENRPLSIEEYKRLQQFPDSWQIEGSLVEQYKQVGNAVPVGLGKAVGELIIKVMKGENIPVFNNFKYSRYVNTGHKDWEAEFNRIRNQLLKAS